MLPPKKLPTLLPTLWHSCLLGSFLMRRTLPRYRGMFTQGYICRRSTYPMIRDCSIWITKNKKADRMMLRANEDRGVSCIAFYVNLCEHLRESDAVRNFVFLRWKTGAGFCQVSTNALFIIIFRSLDLLVQESAISLTSH